MPGSDQSGKFKLGKMEESPQEDIITCIGRNGKGITIIEKRKYKLQLLKIVLKLAKDIKCLENREDHIFQPNQMAYTEHQEQLADTKTKLKFYNQQWESLVNKDFKK